MCKSTRRMGKNGFDDADDDYKNNDGIIYNEDYWQRVKKLNIAWMQSPEPGTQPGHAEAESKLAIMDGKELSDIILRKWGKRYNCGIIVTEDGMFAVVVKTSHLPNDAEPHEISRYFTTMNDVVNKINYWGCGQEVYDAITYHINNKGPDVGGWMFGGSGKIIVKTSVCVAGSRHVEWDL